MEHTLQVILYGTAIIVGLIPIAWAIRRDIGALRRHDPVSERQALVYEPGLPTTVNFPVDCGTIIPVHHAHGVGDSCGHSHSGCG
jgi:hypothetical protein